MKIDCIAKIYSIVNSKSYSDEGGLDKMLFETLKFKKQN